MTARQVIGRVLALASYPATWGVIRFTTRVRGLIVVKDEILLVKNWYGTGSWTLPGGGINRGELPAQAATRELTEELGLTLLSNQLKSLGEFQQTKAHRYKFHGFLTELDKKPEITVNNREIVEAAWVKTGELAELRPRQHAGLLVAAWRKQR